MRRAASARPAAAPYTRTSCAARCACVIPGPPVLPPCDVPASHPPPPPPPPPPPAASTNEVDGSSGTGLKVVSSTAPRVRGGCDACRADAGERGGTRGGSAGGGAGGGGTGGASARRRCRRSSAESKYPVVMVLESHGGSSRVGGGGRVADTGGAARRCGAVVGRRRGLAEVGRRRAVDDGRGAVIAGGGGGKAAGGGGCHSGARGSGAGRATTTPVRGRGGGCGGGTARRVVPAAMRDRSVARCRPTSIRSAVASSRSYDVAVAASATGGGGCDGGPNRRGLPRSRLKLRSAAITARPSVVTTALLPSPAPAPGRSGRVGGTSAMPAVGAASTSSTSIAALCGVGDDKPRRARQSGTAAAETTRSPLPHLPKWQRW